LQYQSNLAILNTRESEIRHNLAVIHERIRKACRDCNQAEEDVNLLLATKTVSPDDIRIAVEAGATLIGENKVQEFSSKADALADLCITRHFIGHLQRNKVKEVLRHVQCIQTIDNLALAEEVNKRAGAMGRSVEVMIQVNTSFEASKFGIAPENLPELAEQVRNMKNLTLIGLMTIGLNAEVIEDARPSYALLKELGEKLNDKYPEKPIREYSMGMSGDLEIAIEEGATIIRVGSAVFGTRIYP